MPVDDVADSTDWLSTPLSGLFDVESALRCEVCKDFYKTPMITSCAHTFCSICIRRALSHDSKCPLCRATDQELKLRSNWSLEQTVSAFSRTRDAALRLARRSVEQNRSSPKRKADGEADSSRPGGTQSKRLRSSARLSSRAEAAPAVSASCVDVVEDSQDEDPGPEKNDKIVPCPICQRRMKISQVELHIDSCLNHETPDNAAAATTAVSVSPNPRNPTDSRPAQQTLLAVGGQMQYQRQQGMPERLPALNYSICKESALRRKLTDLGISSQGPRPLLERRHREWMTIWNANCDAAEPRSCAELRRDLESWERTQGGKAPAASRGAQSAVAVRDKAFDGAAWASRYGNSYRDLIADARKSRLKTPKNDEKNDGYTDNDGDAAMVEKERKGEETEAEEGKED